MFSGFDKTLSGLVSAGTRRFWRRLDGTWASHAFRLWIRQDVDRTS
jgi:hypothetical protein